tara:strand:+ start:11670 stop:12782 length:1113 start_codon:yes stop_codon:yes gene_type:complete
MKIIFFVHSLRKGGAERLLLQIAKYIFNKGHEIIVLQAVNFDEYQEYSEIKKDYLLDFKEYNWPYIFPELVKKYRKYIQSNEPDLVCVFSPLMIIVAAFSFVKTNTIHVIQGYGSVVRSGSMKQFIYKILDRISLSILKYNVVVPTESLKNACLKYISFKDSDIKVIPSGIDNSQLIFNRKDKDFDNQIIITMLGTIYKEKGQRYAIEAVKHIKKISPNLNILVKIIGAGSDEDYINKKIIENGLEKNVSLLGRRDNAFEIISNSHIFWHLSESEGMPLVVMEAMALGIPVIGFNVRGVNDVIKNGSNGYLAEFKDMNAIASYTIGLINDVEDYNRVRVDARYKIDQIYNIEKMFLNYEKYFVEFHKSIN